MVTEKKNGDFRAPRPSERGPLVDATRKLLEGLAPEDRVKATSPFCKYCGHHIGEGGSCCCGGVDSNETIKD